MPEPPPYTEVPEYIRCRRSRRRPSSSQSKLKPPPPATVFTHADREEALKAAKCGAKKKCRWFGGLGNGSFGVYELSTLVEVHKIV